MSKFLEFICNKINIDPNSFTKTFSVFEGRIPISRDRDKRIASSKDSICMIRAEYLDG